MEEPVNQSIYEWLQQVARSGRTTIYGEIAQVAGYDTSRTLAYLQPISRALDAISEHEHREGRPLLSAVAMPKGATMSGPGFFALAQRLELYPDDSRMEPAERQQARRDFHRAELARVHERWEEE
jgi:hypothetical protein